MGHQCSISSLIQLGGWGRVEYLFQLKFLSVWNPISRCHLIRSEKKFFFLFPSFIICISIYSYSLRETSLWHFKQIEVFFLIMTLELLLSIHSTSFLTCSVYFMQYSPNQDLQRILHVNQLKYIFWFLWSNQNVVLFYI